MSVIWEMPLEDVTLNMHPEVLHIKEQMERFGADAVLMSGSGPTVFGLVQHDSRLQRIYNGLRGFCGQVLCGENDWRIRRDHEAYSPLKANRPCLYPYNHVYLQ